jgi:putative transcriptional regulator
MSKDFIMHRIDEAGRIIRIHADGSETVIEDTSEPRPMTDDEITQAALSDPDAQPLDIKKLRRVPHVRTLRRALNLTQEEFSARYHIPLGTLRDWEQGRSVPDAPAKAYLEVITAQPEMVAKAFERAA